jgi:hypothetical protein
MVFRQSLIPDKKNHSIEMPEEFYGKKVEVVIFEVAENSEGKPLPPPGKKISGKQLLKHFGEAPNFPTQEEIRAKAWPSKW